MQCLSLDVFLPETKFARALRAERSRNATFPQASDNIMQFQYYTEVVSKLVAWQMQELLDDVMSHFRDVGGLYHLMKAVQGLGWYMRVCVSSCSMFEVNCSL